VLAYGPKHFTNLKNMFDLTGITCILMLYVYNAYGIGNEVTPCFRQLATFMIMFVSLMHLCEIFEGS